jgi:beta-lactamase class A
MSLVPISPRPDLALDERLARLVEVFSGRLGYHAIHLESGASRSLRADERFGTASVIKVALVACLLDGVRRGSVSLDELVTLPPRTERVTGGGILKHLDADRFSLRDLAELTIVVSDNAATNAVYERVGGAAAISVFCDALGLSATRMAGPVDFARIERSVDAAIGVSTPRETARLLELVATRQILTPALCETLLGMLARQHYLDQAPRWLGANPYAQWHGRHETLRVANKTGELDGIRADCAVVRHDQRGSVVLAVFTDQSQDLRETVDVEGALCVAECSAAICAAFLGLAC